MATPIATQDLIRELAPPDCPRERIQAAHVAAREAWERFRLAVGDSVMEGGSEEDAGPYDATDEQWALFVADQRRSIQAALNGEPTGA